MSPSSIFPSDAALPERSYQQLYQGVYLQLKKDFHPISEHVTPPALLSGESLFDYTLKLLEVLLHEQPQSLGTLLYRVDLSERKAKAAHLSNDDSVKALAEAVLRREAQKVWYRQNFG